MSARIQNTTPHPDVTTGVQHLFKAIYAGGVPPQTLELVHLRASQINGCSACVNAGVMSAAKAARHYSETQLGALVLMVGVTNLFNRINTTLRVPAGTSWD